ncbi:hypothetical protein JC965_24440 [Aeromonas caviae]|uniref:Uncharacterized protein n=1 Tax=Aeromonas caviae TaxID=648 RepID=A0A7T4C318_AERCA|nr:hypothetical protein [Aeromonas caviae]QQA60900.1 hypothetical protein JC965_24440 [Aeromonas caviae]
MVLLFRRRNSPPIPELDGSKAAEVLFVRDSEGWWLASRMRLSLDPDHFGWSLEEAKSIIESEIAFYAAGQVPADGFAQMLQTASQAGYFGSPSVVHELLFPFFHCLLCKGWRRISRASQREALPMLWRKIRVLRGILGSGS